MCHPRLVQCENVMSLFGYGWRYLQGDIPFLVTECALYGTLRQYLRLNPEISGRKKYNLCKQVANGIEWLHASGICHGDLKLENVLASASGPLSSSGAPAIIAKVSDFSHSILLSLSEETGQSKYLGTAV